MSDAHDAQIERLEEEIEAMRPEMEAACDSFLDATAACLAAFWPEYIDHCIRHAGEAVTGMGGDRLRAVKAQVQEMQTRPKEVARQLLVEDRRRSWPHLATINNLVEANTEAGRSSFGWVGEVQSPSAGRGFLPDALSEPMGKVAGTVAKPLKDADLPVPGSRWGDPTTKIDWTTDMIEAIQQYARWASRAIEKARELGRTRDAREKDDALTRWNKT